MSLDKLKQLSWIYDLTRMGQTSVGENPSVYQKILQHIVSGFSADSGSLALLDRDGRYMTIVAGIDLPSGVIGLQIAPGEGVLGWAVRENTPVLLNGDVSSDSRFQRKRDRRGDIENTSSMCWPLRIEEGAIGGISVNRTMESSGLPFTADELEAGSALLTMVSLALSNIRLHSEQKQQLLELRLLNRQLEDAQLNLVQTRM